MLFQPSLCVFEGKEGILLLAPVRRSCCLELLCCQDGSALSKLGEVLLQHFRKDVDRSRRSPRSFPPKKATRNGRSTVHSIAKNALDPVKGPLDFFPSIPQNDGAPMRATGRILGFGQLSQQPFHARWIEWSVDLDGRVARDGSRDP